MTRQHHDQFAKQYLTELLEPLGQIETSREVSGEPQLVDLYFTPAATGIDKRKTLGLLAKMVDNSCLLEPFRNQPTQREVRDCLLKLFSVQNDLQRKAKRSAGYHLSEEQLPRLWILATSASATLLEGFGAVLALDHWEHGVYFLPPNLKTAIIAINQLPKTAETLWLRILGKGHTQQQAIEELLAGPNENTIRVLELLAIWRINMKLKERLTKDEQELIMNLTPAYQQWRDHTLQQGLVQGSQQGHLEERRDLITHLLQSRFGSLDEALLQVIVSLVKLPPHELSPILLHYSREELVTQFGHNQD